MQSLGPNNNGIVHKSDIYRKWNDTNQSSNSKKKCENLIQLNFLVSHDSIYWEADENWSNSRVSVPAVCDEEARRIRCVDSMSKFNTEGWSKTKNSGRLSPIRNCAKDDRSVTKQTSFSASSSNGTISQWVDTAYPPWKNCLAIFRCLAPPQKRRHHRKFKAIQLRAWSRLF